MFITVKLPVGNSRSQKTKDIFMFMFLLQVQEIASACIHVTLKSYKYLIQIFTKIYRYKTQIKQQDYYMFRLTDGKLKCDLKSQNINPLFWMKGMSVTKQKGKYPREVKICPHRNVFMNVQRSIIHNIPPKKFSVHQLMNTFNKV